MQAFTTSKHANTIGENITLAMTCEVQTFEVGKDRVRLVRPIEDIHVELVPPTNNGRTQGIFKMMWSVLERSLRILTQL
ncbi:hypothetical protein CR513_03322, partial [Mucuna pruriens]